MKYTVVLLITVFLVASCAEKKDPKRELEEKNIQRSKELIAMLNSHDLSTFESYFDEAYINRRPSKDSKGTDRTTLKAEIEGFQKAFRNSKNSIEHIAANGDTVLMHVATSHVFGDGQDAYVMIMKDGKVAELWSFD